MVNVNAVSIYDAGDMMMYNHSVINVDKDVGGENMEQPKMFQVSTLKALMLGYTRPVLTVSDLVGHGDTGLGTFENVDGEMIVVDGKCYRAMNDGKAEPADSEQGVPFASVAKTAGGVTFELKDVGDIDSLKEILNNKVDEGFGLNSMHVVRIDAHFDRVSARSETGKRTQHVELKDILRNAQQDFDFFDLEGTLVCIYYPDYMDGINAAGWHLHFISNDRTRGGHVFDVSIATGEAKMDKIQRIEIQLPADPAFDTYTLTESLGNDIKEVEQGK